MKLSIRLYCLTQSRWRMSKKNRRLRLVVKRNQQPTSTVESNEPAIVLY